jgi:hypothetical protein
MPSFSDLFDRFCFKFFRISDALYINPSVSFSTLSNVYLNRGSSVIIKSPIENVLERVHLSESINDALLHKTGLLSPFLQLSEACEEYENDKIIVLSNALSFDPKVVNNCHTAVLAWAESFTA